MSKGLEKRKLASDVLDYLDDDSVMVMGKGASTL